MKLNAFAATTISPFFSIPVTGDFRFCERRLTGVEANSPNRPIADTHSAPAKRSLPTSLGSCYWSCYIDMLFCIFHAAQ